MNVAIERGGVTNVTILFIGAIRNSFLGGVFILPIGDSTYSTTLIVVTTLNW